MNGTSSGRLEREALCSPTGEDGVSGAPAINFKEDALKDSVQGREGSQDRVRARFTNSLGWMHGQFKGTDVQGV